MKERKASNLELKPIRDFSSPELILFSDDDIIPSLYSSNLSSAQNIIKL